MPPPSCAFFLVRRYVPFDELPEEWDIITEASAESVKKWRAESEAESPNQITGKAVLFGTLGDLELSSEDDKVDLVSCFDKVDTKKTTWSDQEQRESRHPDSRQDPRQPRRDF